MLSLSKVAIRLKTALYLLCSIEYKSKQAKKITKITFRTSETMLSRSQLQQFIYRVASNINLNKQAKNTIQM